MCSGSTLRWTRNQSQAGLEAAWRVRETLLYLAHICKCFSKHVRLQTFFKMYSNTVIPQKLVSKAYHHYAYILNWFSLKCTQILGAQHNYADVQNSLLQVATNWLPKGAWIALNLTLEFCYSGRHYLHWGQVLVSFLVLDNSSNKTCSTEGHTR